MNCRPNSVSPFMMRTADLLKAFVGDEGGDSDSNSLDESDGRGGRADAALVAGTAAGSSQQATALPVSHGGSKGTLAAAQDQGDGSPHAAKRVPQGVPHGQAATAAASVAGGSASAADTTSTMPSQSSKPPRSRPAKLVAPKLDATKLFSKGIEAIARQPPSPSGTALSGHSSPSAGHSSIDAQVSAGSGVPSAEVPRAISSHADTRPMDSSGHNDTAVVTPVAAGQPAIPSQNSRSGNADVKSQSKTLPTPSEPSKTNSDGCSPAAPVDKLLPERGNAPQQSNPTPRAPREKQDRMHGAGRGASQQPGNATDAAAVKDASQDDVLQAPSTPQLDISDEAGPTAERLPSAAGEQPVSAESSRRHATNITTGSGAGDKKAAAVAVVAAVEPAQIVAHKAQDGSANPSVDPIAQRAPAAASTTSKAAKKKAKKKASKAATAAAPQPGSQALPAGDSSGSAALHEAVAPPPKQALCEVAPSGAVPPVEQHHQPAASSNVVNVDNTSKSSAPIAIEVVSSTDPPPGYQPVAGNTATSDRSPDNASPTTSKSFQRLLTDHEALQEHHSAVIASLEVSRSQCVQLDELYQQIQNEHVMLQVSSWVKV